MAFLGTFCELAAGVGLSLLNPGFYIRSKQENETKTTVLTVNNVEITIALTKENQQAPPYHTIEDPCIKILVPDVFSSFSSANVTVDGTIENPVLHDKKDDPRSELDDKSSIQANIQLSKVNGGAITIEINMMGFDEQNGEQKTEMLYKIQLLDKQPKKTFLKKLMICLVNVTFCILFGSLIYSTL